MLSLNGQAPSQPVQRASEEPFPPISQPDKHVDWDAVARVSVLHLLDTYPPASP